MFKKITNYKLRITPFVFAFLLLPFAFFFVNAQEMPPDPGSPRAVSIPKIVESTLPNGLRVIVVERKSVPLVSVNLLVNSGAANEDKKIAGVTSMTSAMLNKGTKTRTAEAISEQMEFLGSGVGGGANWLTSNVAFTATTDKLNQAMTIFADIVLNPTFPQKEIDLYKSQMIDDLATQLKQPGTLASYVAAAYTFGEHSVRGTPETIKAISRKDLRNVYKDFYTPENSTLIFVGDITKSQAILTAKKYLGNWRNLLRGLEEPIAPDTVAMAKIDIDEHKKSLKQSTTLNKMLVIDLPNSGQAAVVYAKNMDDEINGRLKTIASRDSENYFSASVANSLLGGGYSSRMNQEIRIKRGLSYGAGSSIAWRWDSGNFSTRCQTKTVSAAEVAELTLKEIDRLINENATPEELTPRKNVLTGNFGRNFETNFGISNQISELVTFGLNMDELNSFMTKTASVTAEQVKDFSLFNLKGGDIIIVGDYKDFKDDLAKRFPNQKIEVIKESELDLNKANLRK